MVAMAQQHGADHDDLLFDYATGSLPEPVALAVATHVALNEDAQRQSRGYEAVGGALLAALPGEPIDEAGLDDLLDRLDTIEPGRVTTTPESGEESILPQPLQRYLRQDWSSINWSPKGGGVDEYRLPIDYDGYRVSLLRIRPGQAMPQHTHRGDEYTVVLDGAYVDGERRLVRGDIDRADGERQHRPIADAELGCICLIVLDAPVQLTGWVGRLINPFLKN